MADRWAVVVGIDKYLSPDFPPQTYPEADAKAIADALGRAGYKAHHLILLSGPHATKAAIESRLRRLKKLVKKDDSFLAVWIGRGSKAGVLPCWDALPDDLPGTGFAIDELAKLVSATKADAVTLLVSADALPEVEPAGATLLLACEPGEEPLAVNGRGLWSQLVAEAFGGRHRKAHDASHRITASTMQRFLEDELPRRLRKHFEAGTTQTPVLFGPDTPLADLSAKLSDAEAPLLDPARLRRVVFRSVTTTRIKDLSQFRKTFQLPDHAGRSELKFFARIAAPDLKADLDRVYDSAREHLGYKRKDATVVAGTEGFGSLRTPDFEYTVTIDIDEADPTRLVWRREAGQFADPAFVAGPGFAAVFGPAFDHLVFEFAKPVDVADFVDQLEDAPPAGVKVQTDADGTGCEVTLKGIDGVVSVRRHAVTVRGRTGGAAGLLDLFLRFVRQFSGVGEMLQLPAGRPSEPEA